MATRWLSSPMTIGAGSVDRILLLEITEAGPVPQARDNGHHRWNKECLAQVE